VIYPEALLTFRIEAPVSVSTDRAPQAFRPVDPNDYERSYEAQLRTPPPPPTPPPYWYGWPPYYPYFYGPGWGYFYGPGFYFGSRFYFGHRGFYGHRR
jgi:hypothetical protein